MGERPAGFQSYSECKSAPVGIGVRTGNATGRCESRERIFPCRKDPSAF